MKRMVLMGRSIAAIAVVLTLCWTPASGQKVNLLEEKYLQPPKEIADYVLAPNYLNVRLSDLGPDKENFVYARGEGMPTLELYAKPHAILAETHFDLKASRARTMTTRRNSALEVFNYKTGNKIQIKGPQGTWVSLPPG